MRTTDFRSPPTKADGNKIEVTITYLEQLERPTLPIVPRPSQKIALLRLENPPLDYYRYLYRLVGDPWKWVSRRRMKDDTLRTIIHDSKVYIYVLYADGAPAGFAEIDARYDDACEIKFFGLSPNFTGCGLGRFFLTNIIELAWSLGAPRVKLETCTLDHPAALPLYQKMGFTVCDQRKGVVELLDDADNEPQ